MTVSSPVMDLLRESTAEMHTSAEGNEFQRQLGSGKPEREKYVAYLDQLFLMHKRLAELLEQWQSANDALRHVVRDYHLDLSCVKKDIEYFGRNPENAQALKATEALISSMEHSAKTDPAELLGFLYVLEGSTNGAKFMAKALRTGMSLGDDAGASYFDRYGESQRERWTTFKSAMNELPLQEQQRARLVEKARETFRAFGKIGDELQQ